MAGRVFISCGQKTKREKTLAKRIARLLEVEFGLAPYLAFQVQSLNGIMVITQELSKSDYYLFIDFKRDGKIPKEEVSRNVRRESANSYNP